MGAGSAFLDSVPHDLLFWLYLSLNRKRLVLYLTIDTPRQLRQDFQRVPPPTRFVLPGLSNPLVFVHSYD